MKRLPSMSFNSSSRWYVKASPMFCPFNHLFLRAYTSLVHRSFPKYHYLEYSSAQNRLFFATTAQLLAAGREKTNCFVVSALSQLDDMSKHYLPGQSCKDIFSVIFSLLLKAVPPIQVRYQQVDFCEPPLPVVALLTCSIYWSHL